MAADNELMLRALLSGTQGAKILGNLEKVKSIMSSQAGRETLELLSGGGGDALKAAAAAAVEGDKDAAARMISTLTSTPDGAKLLQSVVALIAAGK